MTKSADAFRTISEVSLLLDTPTHVLRFWESRFPQIKPLKRAGGRRYYRPGDVALLAGIKQLLHEDGLTIRGVQKILKEQGIAAVAARSPIRLDDSIDEEAPTRVVRFPDAIPHEDLVAERTEPEEQIGTEPQDTDSLAEAEIPDAPFAADVPQETSSAEIVTFASDAPEEPAPGPGRLLALLYAMEGELTTVERVRLLALGDRMAALRDRLAAPPSALRH
ncbi:MerR family transcriptional regulator [Sinirhodobacter populi]|uniref:MerR family transcriptional regulator n=1 Tax=Paenirhodobacter populi TaxID=2306993 RepID=A0A443KG55_9RHOB|nr:MerR family transcriptional regulator [Sinirhodobacter populi]RWR31718.1 MerR family transcriptional regulator [Sinirhodobacter populi]